MIVLWVTVAGSVGAATRFTVDNLIRRRAGDAFPWATVVINLTGSFLLGMVWGLVLFAGTADAWRLVVGVGFCGGYTTFSAASLETVRLASQGRPVAAMGNALGTLAGTAAAGALGLFLAS